MIFRLSCFEARQKNYAAEKNSNFIIQAWTKKQCGFLYEV